MGQNLSVLLIDDSLSDIPIQALEEAIKEQKEKGIEWYWESCSQREAATILAKKGHGAVLIDSDGGKGLRTLEEIKKVSGDTPIGYVAANTAGSLIRDYDELFSRNSSPHTDPRNFDRMGVNYIPKPPRAILSEGDIQNDSNFRGFVVRLYHFLEGTYNRVVSSLNQTNNTK